MSVRKTMRIAFAEGGLSPETGMERDWISSVVLSLASEYPDSRFDVFVRRTEDRTSVSFLEEMPNVAVHAPSGFLPRMSFPVWRGFWLPGKISACAPDVLHVGAGGIQESVLRHVPGLKCAVTVNDLGFLSRRDGFTWIQRHKYNLAVRRSLRQADMIVAPDSDIAGDIVRYYFIPKDKIAAIPAYGPGKPSGELAREIMALYRTMLSM